MSAACGTFFHNCYNYQNSMIIYMIYKIIFATIFFFCYKLLKSISIKYYLNAFKSFKQSLMNLNFRCFPIRLYMLSYLLCAINTEYMHIFYFRKIIFPLDNNVYFRFYFYFLQNNTSLIFFFLRI